MKVAYWCMGKTDDNCIAEVTAQYLKKITNYIPFQYSELIAPRSKKATEPDKHREYERDEIVKQLKANDTLILLDDKGKALDSVEFAGFLQKKFMEGSGTLIFLSGGPYGFHEDIYRRANDKLSLSKMTFTHQMVRLIFAEQLYRGLSILKGEPYHH